MEVVNLQSGKPEALDEAEALTGILKGTHNLAGGDRILIRPGGNEWGIVPAAEAGKAVGEAGWRVPTLQELKGFEQKARFGQGTGDELAAFGLGVARGASFGLSDVAGAALGASEYLQGFREQNPAASLGGELAGAAGAALLQPQTLLGRGAGAAAKTTIGAADLLNPVGGVLKAGTRVSEALTPAALAPGASLAARVVNSAGQIGARAAGSAIEGAAFGLGSAVTEMALGDPDEVGEMVLSHLGTGALYGGVLGGALKGVGIASEAALTKTKEALGRFYTGALGKPKSQVSPAEAAADGELARVAPEPVLGRPPIIDEAVPPGGGGKVDPGAKLPPPTPPGGGGGGGGAPPPPDDPGAWGARMYARIAATVSKTPEDEIYRKLLAREEIRFLTPAEQSEAAAKWGKELQDVVQNVRKTGLEAAGKIRDQESAALMAPVPRSQVEPEFQRLSDAINGAADQMKAEKALFGKSIRRELDQVRDQLKRASELGEKGELLGVLKSDSAEAFAVINEAKRSLQEIARSLTNSIKRADKRASPIFGDLTNTFKKSLEDEAVWGAAGARQAAFNEKFAANKSAEKELLRRLGEQVETPSGRKVKQIKGTKVNTFFNQINDPVRGGPVKEAVERYMETSRALVSEIEASYKAVPSASFDRVAMDSLLAKASQGMGEAANMVASVPGAGYGRLTDILHPLGGLKAAGNLLRDPDAAVVKLAKLEKMSQAAAEKINRVSKVIFRPITETLAKGRGVIAEKLSPQEKAERFKKRMKDVQAQVRDPETLVDNVSRATEAGYGTAPRVMAAVQRAAISGATFLASKVPNLAPDGPFDPPKEPSPAQIEAFDRYYKAVSRPLSVLEQLAQGRVPKESKEALIAVYPRLYQTMRQALTEQLLSAVAKGARPTYQQRMAIGEFIGENLDHGNSPTAVAANQAILAKAHAQGQQQEQAQSTPKPQDLSLADRSQTFSQRAATA